MFGFLNIYKPKGKTSHDIVGILRHITGVKQIGHTGTLDPFAEGVLPICIGKATRLIDYLDDDKAYIATIQFGAATTTYDIEGEITNVSDKIITEQELNEILKLFTGNIEQIPPIYSAIKVKGKKLYEYARAGKEVDIKPRLVTISELKLLNFDFQKRQAQLYINCSKGTYVRSVADDIGKKAGAFGHLIKLVRVKAGEFKVENSLNLEDLISKETVEQNLINPLEYIHYPKYELNTGEMERVSHGMNFTNNSNEYSGVVILTYNEKIVAVGEQEKNIIKSKKVFV